LPAAHRALAGARRALHHRGGGAPQARLDPRARHAARPGRRAGQRRRRMNPRLSLLQPYPFERLRALLAQPPEAFGLAPTAASQRPERFVNLSIGEPRHATPPLVTEALTGALAGLSAYPATAGTPALREA